MSLSGNSYDHGFFCPEQTILVAGGNTITALSFDDSDSDDLVLKDLSRSYSTGSPITYMCTDASGSTAYVGAANKPIVALNTSDLSVVNSYMAYSHVDEIVHPLSMSLSSDGKRLLGGFESFLKVWDLSRTGRQLIDLRLASRNAGFKGHVGAVAWYEENVVAAGTYTKRLGLFDLRDKSDVASPVSSGCFACGGFNQLIRIDQTPYLLSGHRADDKIRLWDIRTLIEPVSFAKRSSQGHQRLKIDVVNCKAFAGDDQGHCNIYKIKDGCIDLLHSEKIHKGPVTFFTSNKHLLLTASWTRTSRITGCTNDNSSDSSENEEFIVPSELRLFKSSIIEAAMRYE